MDSAIGFPNTYPLDSDLSSGQRYPTFEQPGPADVKQRKHSLLSKIWAFEHSSLESNLTLHSLVPNEAYWLAVFFPDSGWDRGVLEVFKKVHLLLFWTISFSHITDN